jgi:hypothetical protein
MQNLSKKQNCHREARKEANAVNKTSNEERLNKKRPKKNKRKKEKQFYPTLALNNFFIHPPVLLK